MLIDAQRLASAWMARAAADPHVSPSAVGLPDGIRACLFDLDGVLTDTARVHAAAWKETFDGFLRERAARLGERFVPFEIDTDYAEYIDGRPRLDGVRTFLASRGIVLPEGTPSDPAAAGTVVGLGTRKNELVLARIRAGDAHAYPGSIRYLRAVIDAGLARAVVSASANCREVLQAAGIESLFDVIVDGHVAAADGLRGKPAPDTYLAAARKLDVPPHAAAVFEDALAGVEAGRAGEFGCVVGVDRIDHAQALREHGADVVVTDLSKLLPA
jgi:beta-phosphoglucomutase family hydrolase